MFTKLSILLLISKNFLNFFLLFFLTFIGLRRVDYIYTFCYYLVKNFKELYKFKYLFFNFQIFFNLFFQTLSTVMVVLTLKKIEACFYKSYLFQYYLLPTSQVNSLFEPLYVNFYLRRRIVTNSGYSLRTFEIE